MYSHPHRQPHADGESRLIALVCNEVFTVQESSVAQGLAEFVCEQIGGMDLSHQKVAMVKIRMGALCGVAPIALKTAFSAVVIGTPLQSCRLEIEPVELVVFCPHCHCEQVVGDTSELKCPACGARTPRVIQGRELEIASIETISQGH